ncbi:MAG: TIGR03936 family radical SAM-associated protein [Stackebrandtia sp.]
MSPKKQPEQQEPVVQRLRVRYTKRGRLRFTSHRDFARALERALRRAGVAIAYSSGFHPHPRVSYQSAAPTGVASEAEYTELALRRATDPAEVARNLDAALPPGLDILEVVEAHTGGFADRLEASRWRIELSDISPADVDAAVAAFLAAEEVTVTRLTKKGNRAFDARSAVVSAKTEPVAEEASPMCAILELVVRQVTPAVRPDDVLSGLSLVANLELPVPPRVTRLAQGPLTESGDIADPLHADRVKPRVSAGELSLA